MIRTRSYLYVPGDVPRMLEKAAASEADAIIADLEDAVAPTHKHEARSVVADWLRSGLPWSTRAQRWVRVNAGEPGLHDIVAVWSPFVHGVCVPKAASEADLRAMDETLTALEGPDPARRTAIMPLVESALGLLRLEQLATGPRVTRLQLGEVDLAADLGIDPDEQGTELLAARSQVVVASRAHGLPGPIGGVSLERHDPDRLRDSTAALRRLGFGARAIIHPQQAAPVHEAFAVSAQEHAAAALVVAGYEESLRNDVGVYRDENGRMVDEAVVRRSRDVIASADEEGATA